MARKLLVLCALLAAFVAPGSASASFIVARDAAKVVLGVDAKGVAMVTFRQGGVLEHVMARGAVDALTPRADAKQVAFDVDWAGGWGWEKQQLWKTFRNACGRYDGPALAYLVTACKASDGSYWALQSWQRMLPNLGFTPWTKEQSVRELHLSHWTGVNLARIEVHQGWVYSGRFNGIFGKVTYADQPVHGFGSSKFGVPTDAFGRNLFLDTLDAKSYGPGWKRENSFLAHKPSGAFCYGFYTFDPTKGGYRHPAGQSALRGPGVGVRYRLSMIGPGVSPDVTVEVPALHAFDRSSPADVDLEEQSNTLLEQLDPTCHS